MAQREFSLGAFLSVTSGILLCDMEELTDMLCFLCQDNLFTHQLPRAIDECRPYLLAKFPFLSDLAGAGELSSDSFTAALYQAEIEHGESLSIDPMPIGMHRVVHPVEEAIEKGMKVFGAESAFGHERSQ